MASLDKCPICGAALKATLAFDASDVYVNEHGNVTRFVNASAHDTTTEHVYCANDHQIEDMLECWERKAVEAAADVRSALLAFIDTIEGTGGVLETRTGLYRPVGDEEWIDLGETYVCACKVLNLVPHITKEDEDDDDQADD